MEYILFGYLLETKVYKKKNLNVEVVSNTCY